MLGRFLLGCNSTYTAGSTGGSATHTLGVNNLPNHKHVFANGNNEWVYPTVDRSHSDTWGASYSDTHDYKINTSPDQKMEAAAYSQPVNHMPPYLSVYIWKRTK